MEKSMVSYYSLMAKNDEKIHNHFFCIISMQKQYLKNPPNLLFQRDFACVFLFFPAQNIYLIF